jgi:hypothetical protein
MTNNVTLNTASYTTPLSKVASFKSVFPTATLSVLSYMKFSMKRSILPSIFQFLNFLMIVYLQLMSYALDISRVVDFFLKASAIWFWKIIRTSVYTF